MALPDNLAAETMTSAAGGACFGGGGRNAAGCWWQPFRVVD
jgi:hypothetical protein